MAIIAPMSNMIRGSFVFVIGSFFIGANAIRPYAFVASAVALKIAGSESHFSVASYHFV